MKKLGLLLVLIVVFSCSGNKKPKAEIQPDITMEENSELVVTLPKDGELLDGKPIGENWKNMIANIDDWVTEEAYWQMKNGMLHGESTGGDLHHHTWTRQKYKDFELQAVIRMTGKGANSGVCIRLNPTDPDNAPGYQIDMGPGYWGCLWEERRAGMVQRFPEELADKLVNKDDWNHYYVRAKGPKIEAWLNGVKTIDTVHKDGFLEGSIGFQLCHGESHTILDVKTLFLREL